MASLSDAARFDARTRQGSCWRCVGSRIGFTMNPSVAYGRCHSLPQ